MDITRELHPEGPGKVQYELGQASWFSSRESFQVEFTIVSLD